MNTTSHSELIGSFIRNGSFPLEADYIFSTEQKLKEFYSDELNKTILHKGLFKIVEKDENDKQALFWIVEKDENLIFEKLISADTVLELIEQLEQLEEKLNNEIEERKEVDEIFANAFNEFKNLVELAYQELLKTDAKLREDLNATVGTNEDIIEHLKTLPYESLTDIALNLDNLITNALPEIVNNIYGSPLPSEDFRSFRKIEDFVRLIKLQSEHSDENIQSELDQTQIGVGLNADGSFSPDLETKHLKNATSVMNALKILDSAIDSYKSSIVKSGYYDSEHEDIVLVLEFNDDTTEELRISAHSLVEEWDILNDPNSSITLSKKRNINGQDVLSADINLSPNKYNILKKDGQGRLLVKGTADNIVFEGDLSVQEKINLLDSENTKQQLLIENLTSDLQKEVQRAKDAEHSLSDDIIQEKNRAELIEQSLQNQITQEKDRAEAAENNLSDKITSVETNIRDNINSLINNINERLTEEINRSTSKDNEFSQALNDVNTAINNETTRAKAEESNLKTQIEANDKIISDKLKDLEKDLDSIEQLTNNLEKSINDKLKDLELKDLELKNLILDEIERAKEAEEDLAIELRYYTERVDDIEAHPIINSFITDPNQLPDNPNNGDSYIFYSTVGDNTSYWLYEWDGKKWQTRVLQIGTLVPIINGEVYKLSSSGLEHLLDESDLTESNSMQFKLVEEDGNFKLTSNLKIDSDTNNLSDILLDISESGLSAQIIVSEYD